jgi:Holliday junction DNA helicase RuvA
MIGFVNGEVLFSDGNEVILQTTSGIGYQIFYNKVLAEGTESGLFISHIIKEDSQTMYGHHSLRAKKLFEMLLTVKGIGPKSAYALVSNIGVNEIIQAINLEAKATLTKVPGLGTKGAAQIILDLSGKINKVKMYTDVRKISVTRSQNEKVVFSSTIEEDVVNTSGTDHHEILNDTLMACKELGFKEEKIISLAQRILSANQISKAEQLIHLVLKEI